MKILLDTNICIYIIKRQPQAVLQRFHAYQIGDVGVSSITVAELEFGVRKSQFPEQNQQALTQFLLTLAIADFDSTAASAYGVIKAELEERRTPIGSLDTLIAAHALSLDITLITNNVKEFNRVPKLKLENWVD